MANPSLLPSWQFAASLSFLLLQLCGKLKGESERRERGNLRSERGRERKKNQKCVRKRVGRPEPMQGKTQELPPLLRNTQQRSLARP